jgi:hypothetical protein
MLLLVLVIKKTERRETRFCVCVAMMGRDDCVWMGREPRATDSIIYLFSFIIIIIIVIGQLLLVGRGGISDTNRHHLLSFFFFKLFN